MTVVDLSASDGVSSEELADAIRPHFQEQQPVLVRGAVAASPAVELWKSRDYWKATLARNTTGQIEIGGSYASVSSDRAEIPMHAYLDYLEAFEDRHGSTGSVAEDPLGGPPPTDIPAADLVYMAQNDLPQEMMADVNVPDFCQNGDYNVGLGRLYSVMLWLGPRGSVSPLHFDPLDNILMQYQGRKLVWLFAPKPGAWPYAGHGGQQTNTSPVNPEDKESLMQYPLFATDGPPATQCVLSPGDCLFIPSKWWHFVRSIDTSASVNVWWR